LQGRWAMSFEQIHTPSMEGPGTDEEALVQTPPAEAGKHWRVKLGIVGSVLLLGAASVFVVSPPGGTASSTRSDVAESIVSMASKYGSFTSPYYYHRGRCPEGELIVVKSDCTEAGGLLGAGTKTGVDRDTSHAGCRYGVTQVTWNPDLTGTGTLPNTDSICKRLPKDMHDFEALQADQEAMTFHCLEEADAFAGFKDCMFQMKTWNLDRKWTEEEMKEQRKAANLLANEQANEKEKAEHSCWTRQDDKVAGDLPTFGWHYNLLDAKVQCRALGDACTAISCYKGTGFSGMEYDACAPRGAAEYTTLSDAPSSSRKYQVYTACDGEAEEAAEEAEEEKEKDEWTKHSSRYAGGYANGHGQKYDLAGAKAKCLELSECNAITCNQGLTICSCRASSTLNFSPSGEMSFTHSG